MLLNLDAPEMLKKAKLDGRTSDVFFDSRGRKVEVSGLTRDYNLYVLGSRTASYFSHQPIEWSRTTLRAKGVLVFRTAPKETPLPFTLVLDGTSPYKIPSNLRPQDVVSIEAVPPMPEAMLLGLKFVHSDGSCINYFLTPDLLHFIRFDTPTELTDFKVEYIGIACGENGSSDVFKRATAHEKVVEISGVFQRTYGNRDLFIFAYNPAFSLLHEVPGGVILTTEEVLKMVVSGGENSLFEAMEASLISVFQPHYNKEFKKFPENRPNWLQGGFNDLDGVVLGVEKICVTLATDSSFNVEGTWSFGRFRSDQLRPRLLHYLEIPVGKPTGARTG
ncbi:hypothetical protein C5F53_18015 [Rhodoferax sp. TS-BS-61-7]|nr:hypothetical protein C5F53_18015 [Rhodoferax sp. TS-BS-61-7]